MIASLLEGIYCDWQFIPNAWGYRNSARLQGMTSWWADGRAPTYASYFTWCTAGNTKSAASANDSLTNVIGQIWEFDVATIGDFNDQTGDYDYSDFTDVIAVTCNPSTAPAPSVVITAPYGDDGIAFFYNEVPGYDINRFVILVWDLDTEDAWVQAYATTETVFQVTGLARGHRYRTWVSSWTELNGHLAGGLPNNGREVIIEAGTPGPHQD